MNFLHDSPFVDVEVEITAGDTVDVQNRIVIEAIADGRVTAGYIPVVFVGK